MPQPKCKPRLPEIGNDTSTDGYYAVTHRFRTTRDARAEIAFFRTIDRAIVLPDADEISPDTATQIIKERTPASSQQ